MKKNIISSSPSMIETATSYEIDFFIQLAANEGWNPGLQDGYCFYQIDPKGFFIEKIDQQPIGCISAVAYDETFGFLGFYIVKEDFRHQGFGMQLWNRAIRYLGKRNIGLDGVVERQNHYKESGFQLAYRSTRFEGVGKLGKISKQVTPLSQIPFIQIVEYDYKLFPFDRSKFLHHWIHMSNAISYGMIWKEKLVGYGVIRKCQRGYKIGPLFADHPDFAEDLFYALNAHILDAPFFLDVPEINPIAIELAHQNKMKKVFETARMYTKGEPKHWKEGIYGITTFEVG